MNEMRRVQVCTFKKTNRQSKVFWVGFFFPELQWQKETCLCRKCWMMSVYLLKSDACKNITKDWCLQPNHDCFSDLLDIKSPPLHIKICTLCVFFSSHALLAKTLVEACQVIWSYQLVGKAGLSIHWTLQARNLVPFSPSATSTLNLVGCKHLFQNESHPLQSAGCHYVSFQNIMLLPSWVLIRYNM